MTTANEPPITRVPALLRHFADLRDTGTIAASGLARAPDGSSTASWTLSWPEQRAQNLKPIMLEAHYGIGFHHPHLHGATVGEWPLNVFDEEHAAELPILRAIASPELHKLVFQRDYRIVPAITAAKGTR